MKISTFLKPLSFIPALLIMYMIYSFSAETGNLSSDTSFKVSRGVVKVYDTVADKNWEDWQIDQKAQTINPYVRKGAHMTEYFLLAVAVSFPLYVYGVRGILLMLLAGLICIGYAFGDEYHQASVAGRVSSKRDVAIDSIGIFAGIILVRIMGWSARVSVTGPRMEKRQRKMQEELDRREEELERRERELRREERRSGFSDGNGGDLDERFVDGRGRTFGHAAQPYDEKADYNGRRDSCDSSSLYPEDDDEEYDRYEKPDYRGNEYDEHEGYEKPDYPEEADEDSSDELSEDIPIFSRRKHTRQ